MDRTQNVLEQSATSFFSKMYPNSEINFKDKTGGTRAGIIVTVTQNDTETNYYMKTYHEADSLFTLQKTKKQYWPDLREMFVYRILEFINIGPTVFFPYYSKSILIHFIATEEVNEFKEFEKIDDINLRNKVIIEVRY